MKNKLLKHLLIVALMLVVALPLHAKEKKQEESPKPKVELKTAVANAYKAYSLESMRQAKEKVVKCAEVLHKKEVAEGKTDKEFKGLAVVSYSIEALDESDFDDVISDSDRLALLLPFILAILIIIALVLSIRLGLGSIRRLDFNNDATMFQN